MFQVLAAVTALSVLFATGAGAWIWLREISPSGGTPSAPPAGLGSVAGVWSLTDPYVQLLSSRKRLAMPGVEPNIEGKTRARRGLSAGRQPKIMPTLSSMHVIV